MDAVGIIANPASGKDIRRLVAYGTVFDNQEKVNIVRRVLLGLAAVGIKQVVFMPDYFGMISASGSPLAQLAQTHHQVLLAADHPEDYDRYSPMVSRLLHLLIDQS